MRSSRSTSSSSSSVVAGENARINVFIRCRPPPPQVISIVDPTREDGVDRDFLFDNIFDIGASQDTVYRSVCKPLVDHVLDGFNGCIFAYGQTGSGKTYSIFGRRGEERGILPRAVEYLFENVERRRNFSNVSVYVSFMEIYMDIIGDLGKWYVDRGSKVTGRIEYNPGPMLPAEGSRPRSSSASFRDFVYPMKGLEVHEHPNGTVFVKDLEVIPVESMDEVMAVINMGVSKRATFETNMNEYSSRSHTIFTITVVQTNPRDENRQAVSGMLNIVDLAGSERLKRSESEGQRLKEAVSINKSLSALGNVILGIDRGDPHIPYRDSKLTRVLQDSLGGNSYTSLLSTLTPSSVNFEESLATLLFSLRCKNVENMPRVNYLDMTAQQQENIIRKLQDEIASLRQQLSSAQQLLSAQSSHSASRALSLSDRAYESAAYGNLESGVLADGNRSYYGGVSTARSGGKVVSGRGSSAPVDADPSQKRFEREASRLKVKLEQKNAAFKTIQDLVQAEQQKHNAIVDQYRQKLADMSNSVEIGRRQLVNLLNENSSSHEEMINEVIVHNHQLLKQQHDLMLSIPNSLKSMSEKKYSVDEAISETKSHLEAQFREQLRALDASKEKVIQELRSAFDEIMTQKKQECFRLAEALHESQSKAETDILGYQSQLEHAYELVGQLTNLVEGFESGRLPSSLRSGIKRLRTPSKSRMSLHDENLKNIQKVMDHVELFHDKVQHLNDRIGNDEDENLEMDDVWKEKEEHSQGLRSDHPTARDDPEEYVSSLESELARYKELFQREQKHARDLKIALDARGRELDRLKKEVKNSPSSSRLDHKSSMPARGASTIHSRSSSLNMSQLPANRVTSTPSSLLSRDSTSSRSSTASTPRFNE